MPPGYPCRFPFPFSFLLFFSLFLRFSTPFCRSPCFPSLFVFRSFYISSGRFPFFLALPSSPFFRFPALLGGGFCYSVLSSWSYTPLAILSSLTFVYSLACCLLYCVLDVDIFYFFFSSFPFFDFDLDIGFFILSFLAGTMLSPRFRLLLRFV